MQIKFALTEVFIMLLGLCTHKSCKMAKKSCGAEDKFQIVRLLKVQYFVCIYINIHTINRYLVEVYDSISYRKPTVPAYQIKI